MTNDPVDHEFWKARTFDENTRRHLRHETQTPTSGHPGDAQEPRRPGPTSGRVRGNADEAREIPTDVVVRRPGEPDAFAQMPAAAPAMTDEEAGLDDKPPEGGIQPLPRRGEGT
jgi:hypothetical protein